MFLHKLSLGAIRDNNSFLQCIQDTLLKIVDISVILTPISVILTPLQI